MDTIPATPPTDEGAPEALIAALHEGAGLMDELVKLNEKIKMHPSPKLEADREKLRATLLEGEKPQRKLAGIVASAFASNSLSDDEMLKFLKELREDILSIWVLAEFAKAFFVLMRNPGVEQWANRAIDVCGTGGDHSGSFNISTATSFVVASAGVPMFKHGNRSSTSKCGSADLLEKLGFPIEAPDEVWRKSLKDLSFAFFFAPAYHPAFKHVAHIRKKLGQKGLRTVFNLLGPMLNPGRPKYQLAGVYNLVFAKTFAAALLQALKVHRGLVVHGYISSLEGMDELSVSCKNLMTGAGELRFLDPITKQPRKIDESKLHWIERDMVALTPEEVGLAAADISDLKGGNSTENVEILKKLLENKAPAGLRDTVLLNAGAALWVAEKAPSLKDGVNQARELLLGGKVKKWLADAQAFFREVKP